VINFYTIRSWGITLHSMGLVIGLNDRELFLKSIREARRLVVHANVMQNAKLLDESSDFANLQIAFWWNNIDPSLILAEVLRERARFKSFLKRRING